MASSGPNSAGAGASEAGTGTNAWSNPSNVTSADSTYARATYTGAGMSSTEYLNSTSFGFSIPTGATIDGIVAEVKRYYGGVAVTDSRIFLLKTGTEAGSNKSTGASWPSVLAYVTFGSSSDLWGTTWSPSDINASGFGLQVSPTLWGFGGSATAYVDHVRITVYYTEAAAGGLPSRSLRQSRSRSLITR